MILAIKTSKSKIVDEYLELVRLRLEKLSWFSRRFDVEYKKFDDAEGDYFILFKIKIFLLGIIPLLIVGTGFIYLSSIFHAPWLILVGVVFFLFGIVQTPQFWYYIMRVGLKKAGYTDKVSMISYGVILERLYDGAK